MVEWSFRKTGTVGTLASQAEIDVWVQAPRALKAMLGASVRGGRLLPLRESGSITPPEIF